MRIISGKWGGRVLKVPSGLPVRPTTDRTKESLFSMIASRREIKEMEVLEICCGTGNISLEFASRGAAKVIAIDKDRKCVQAVKDLSQSLGDTGTIQVLQGDIEKFLAQPSKWLPPNPQFDLIFIDPPYALPYQHLWVEKIFTLQLLKEKGWLIIEHSSLLSFESVPHIRTTRKYGSSSISFFTAQESDF
jgi:16S rRNA (guanine(966)-N(2))-methyltransferase RsmD